MTDPEITPMSTALQLLLTAERLYALHGIDGVSLRQIALENPSHYLVFDSHEFAEVEFLVAIARASGCALLLDVNNVFVSASNLGYDAAAVIDAVPADLIAEVHLAGHSADPAIGTRLLIDTHDAPVAPAVWSLYERLIARIGARPTLIERDENIPAFAELLAERERAHTVLTQPLEEELIQ